ncbi:MAG: site-specific DNA-methyltransferase [Acidobacteriota bacterium]|nr:site-specific DNA-methyltransferase [Acidobacteriota bacterium]MDQ3061743.1 site-specific DNA-methyltransferase [Acidobacteriota bacterium]
MSILNGKSETRHQIFNDACLKIISSLKNEFDLTFLDPPFNQQKDYASWNDDLPEKDYWEMMREVCLRVLRLTADGGAIYFMQREKNAEHTLRVLRETGWTFQNLIVWKKMTSAVPSAMRFGKAFQIIGYATKGNRPRVFNRLRIEPSLLKHQKHERENGCFVTDVWDDIRELTSGYFAGDEAFKNTDNTRFHKQQSPIALLLRIILSSTRVGDSVLDPFAGTGTTAIVANQLNRNSVSIEINSANVSCIEKRLSEMREADSIRKFYKDYICTENLAQIWKADFAAAKPDDNYPMKTLFSL